MRAVHPLLAQVLDSSICLFGIFQPDTQSVEVAWQVHDGQELPGGAFPLGNGFTSQVIRTGEPLLIGDWQAAGPHVQVQYAAGTGGLPRSSVTAPACVAHQVRGVLSVQSYVPNAFDSADLAFVGQVADAIAHALFAAPDQRHVASRQRRKTSAAVLVLDAQGDLVQMNAAARRLLCIDGRSLIFGYPVCEPQGDQWPLGTRRVAEALRPLVDALCYGATPVDHVSFELEDGQRLLCSGSLVRRRGESPRALLELRQIGG